MYGAELRGNADWRVFLQLWPFLWRFKARVLVALGLLVIAKVATLMVPVTLKHVVDALDAKTAALWVPLALVAGYGMLRFLGTAFQELRDIVFARVGERTLSEVGVSVFRHLLSLDIDYHLSRKTGGVARDIERGVNGAAFLVRAVVFSVVPIAVEVLLVVILLMVEFRAAYALAALSGIAAYVALSVLVTNWRTEFVRLSNDKDSAANSRAVDSLINVETVKHFCNEDHEVGRYTASLRDREEAKVKTAVSLALLNGGQALVIAATMTVILLLAAKDTAEGLLSIGEFAMVNALMIQVFIPMNILGMIYREIRRSLTDLEAMLALMNITPKVQDSPGAVVLQGDGVEFEDVVFGYRPERRILDGVSFSVPPGRKVAIVGPSGSGKSTLGRLLLRFYDVQSGSVRVGGVDVRDLTQQSLRAAIGTVPQDAVLFNDTIRTNIGYGKPGADEQAIAEVARLAHLDEFLAQLPERMETRVGERGLKVSGGERQRIAIARTLLKNPRIVLFDEATSSLDTVAERAISQAMREVASTRTTLIIAHRLSTVVDADEILVLSAGRIVERGTHAQLLSAGGAYKTLWDAQLSEGAEA